jgi:CMP-N-acetylneuraminic acid synthetase
MKLMDILGIIPARGGSKSLRKKNIRKLAGKPLIYYTIKEAKKSKFITKLVVSTENLEISKIVKKYGVQVIPRPKNLAKDNTPSLVVFRQVINYLHSNSDFNPDVIVVLQPTSPLRKVIDIDYSIKKFLKNKPKTIVSISKFEHPPSWIFKIVNGKLKPIIKSPKILRRQESPILYSPNGAIYVFNSSSIMKKDFEYGANDLPYIMPIERSIDIDSELDFKLAELLFKRKKSSK